MMDTSKLNHTLAAARKAHGWSQRNLAKLLNMKQSQISDIESGKRDMRVSTLVELARSLELEPILVPRRLLPAVSYVLQSREPGSSDEQKSMYEAWQEDEG